MTEYIALLRGINVGRAKRIAMAELRGLVEDLGGRDVRTLLNSGNVVFRDGRSDGGAIAADIEAAVARQCGFSAAVVVLGAATLRAAVRENPLAQAAQDPSRFLLAFTADAARLDAARALLAEDWAPEALAVGSHAAYLWCANGILASRLATALARLGSASFTTRNWSTVLKLHAMLD